MILKDIGIEWKDLGRLLSINESDLEAIDYDEDILEEKIEKMLRKWECQNGKANLIELSSSLNTLKQLELVKDIERVIGTLNFNTNYYFS